MGVDHPCKAIFIIGLPENDFSGRMAVNHLLRPVRGIGSNGQGITLPQKIFNHGRNNESGAKNQDIFTHHFNFFRLRN